MSKRSIARVICPLAPFLVPKRVIHGAPPSIGLSRLSETCQYFGTTSCLQAQHTPKQYFRRWDKERQKLAKRETYMSDVKEFVYQVKQENYDALKEGFDKYAAQLHPTKVAKMAQLLHQELRRRATGRTASEQNCDDVIELADRFVLAMREGKVALERMALVHLLSTYKEAKVYDSGERFWNWLVKQDSDAVDTRVYGAAIELLAYQGTRSLADLEDLYKSALARIPWAFAEYHLSPEAIVPDRSKFTKVDRIPMALLQGIFTARVLYGDWRGGYLAFDTALRLYPTQIPFRFYDLLMHERPLPEAHKVSLMASRSLRTTLKRINRLLDQLSDLGVAPRTTTFNASDFYRNLGVCEAMVDVLEVYVATADYRRGRLLPVARVAKAMASLMVPLESNQADHMEYRNYNSWLIDHLEELILEVTPRVEGGIVDSNNLLISLAREFGDKSLALRAFQRLQEGYRPPNDSTYAAMLKVAGRVGFVSDVEAAWRSLTHHKQLQGLPLEDNDWIHFAIAVKELKEVSGLAMIETEMLKFGVTDPLRARIRSTISPTKWRTRAWTAHSSFARVDFEDVKSRIIKTTELLKSLLLQETVEVRRQTKLPELPPDIGFQPVRLRASDEQLVEIYDSMTTDPSIPPEAAAGSTPDVDEFGVSMAVYRFDNWVSVNELLDLAEADAKYQEWLAEEVNSSDRPVEELRNDRNTLARYEEFRRQKQGTAKESNGETQNQPDTAAVRQRIMELRGLES